MTGVLRRVIRSVLRRMGVHVASLGPRRFLLDMTTRPVRKQALARGAWLVTDPSVLRRTDVHVASLGPRRFLLDMTTRPVPKQALARGAWLVTDRPRARRHRHALDKALSHHLATEQVCHVLKLYGVNVVIDVGANEGQYASALRRCGYRGVIHSFEPGLAAYEVLTRASASDPLWHTHRLALGREESTMSLNAVPGTLSSFLPATEFGAERYNRLKAPQAEQVAVRRLDRLLPKLLADVADPRPYLKLDTQGYDLEVFAGLGDTAESFVAMQSEVALLRIYAGMPRMSEALNVYEAAGFEIAGLYTVTKDVRTSRVLEFDCILVRAGASRRVAGPR